MLPQTSEKELIRALKQYRDIPVIIVSTISDVNMTVTLFELGAVGIIILNMIKADLYRILKRKAIYILSIWINGKLRKRNRLQKISQPNSSTLPALHWLATICIMQLAVQQ